MTDMASRGSAQVTRSATVLKLSPGRASSSIVDLATYHRKFITILKLILIGGVLFSEPGNPCMLTIAEENGLNLARFLL